LTAKSRLSCQANMADRDVVVEIPRYSINQVKERR
jgi:2Fe-2S ferredoxin